MANPHDVVSVNDQPVDRTKPADPQGLDWITLATQLGLTPPPNVGLLPNQMDKGDKGPVIKQETMPKEQAKHDDDGFKSLSLWNGARYVTFAGAGAEFEFRRGLKTGDLSRVPGNAALGFGVALADNIIDEKFFGDTPARLPSKIADVGSMFVLYTPQPAALKAVEMMGIHVLGRFGDKWL